MSQTLVQIIEAGIQVMAGVIQKAGGTIAPAVVDMRHRKDGSWKVKISFVTHPPKNEEIPPK